MNNKITKSKFSYPSSNGEYIIHANCWRPVDNIGIKAILQIAHGMAEHINRYDDFARFVARKGIVVYANDHSGHGLSVNSENDFGYFGKSEGRTHLVQDMHMLSLIAKKEWSEKPLFLLGHSMGSFLSRKYTALYGTELSGAIYMGTGNGNPFISIALLLAELITKLKGRRSPGKLLDKLAFGNFNKHVTSPKTKFDWLSVNHENVKQYLDDTLNGFTFTNSAFIELFSVIKEVTNEDWAGRLPKDLPILLISGKEDPVGDYGKGVEKTGKLLRKAGLEDVTLKLYDGMRHEILNETDYLSVYQYIYNWLDKHLETRFVK